MYEGKEPCPGCGRSGAEVARSKKQELCYDCQQKLRLGDSLAKERGLERNYYRMDELTTANMTWYVVSIKEIDQPLRKLFKTLSQFNINQVCANYSSSSFLGGDGSSVTAHDTFVLPKITVEAAKELCEAIKEVSWKLRREEREYKERLDKELAEQKNEIYNEGVEYGRNLLFQLNNGEICIGDFTKRIKKF